MLFDNSVYNREPEAVSLANIFCREKGVEKEACAILATIRSSRLHEVAA